MKHGCSTRRLELEGLVRALLWSAIALAEAIAAIGITAVQLLGTDSEQVASPFRLDVLHDPRERPVQMHDSLISCATRLQPLATSRLAMWVWTSETVLIDSSETAHLLDDAAAIGLTDIFLYLTAENYVRLEDLIRRFNASAASRCIRVWGLEGWRGYFSDAHGPAELYDAARRLIAFNASVAPEERFVGFHADLEPQDGQGVGEPMFHNGIPGSKLLAWQAADRMRLMEDWVDLHAMLSRKLRSAGLRYSAALPSWVDDYWGEPVHLAVGKQHVPVMSLLMPLIDEYVIMSYNTDPENAVNRVVGELAYADRLDANRRPVILAAIETHRGVGMTISYGDNPIKGTKAAALADIQTIACRLSVYTSFGGMAIHDWVGWRDLPTELVD